MYRTGWPSYSRSSAADHNKPGDVFNFLFYIAGVNFKFRFWVSQSSLSPFAVYVARSRHCSKSRVAPEEQKSARVQDQTDSTSDYFTEHLDWVVFGAVWAFLVLNAAVYLKRSQE